eukprot:TRINITY_DN5107_c0_g1_i1.p1 TRINITY_DN5107_c0_g1~~TRINITY_DN5107_c0_g1_i1.p1  ORF type:complete len:499 (+),score=65.43 TRINITY_DN5107_c0_g1_i1:119-1498(+)
MKSEGFRRFLMPELVEHLEKRTPFQMPTIIQEKVLEKMLLDPKTAFPQKNYFIGAETGSGKTLAYLLPIINHALTDPLDTAPIPATVLRQSRIIPHGAILCPNRDLIAQIKTSADSLIPPGMKDKITFTPLYGNDLLGYRTQPTAPQRCYTISTMNTFLINLQLIPLQRTELDKILSLIVMDEFDYLYDVMYTHGFSSIFSHYFRASNRQKGLFVTDDAHNSKNNVKFVFAGATLSNKGRKSPSQFLSNLFPKDDLTRIVTDEMHRQTPKVTQEFIPTKNDAEKFQILHDIIKSKQPETTNATAATPPREKILVFVKTLKRAQDLHEKLQELLPDQTVLMFHKKIPTEERTKIFERFQNKKGCSIMIATDLASRGLDFNGVDNVVQYDFAASTVHHLHRIGRTGRAHHKGQAFNFYTPAESFLADQLKDNNNAGVSVEATFSRKRSLRKEFKRKHNAVV